MLIVVGAHIRLRALQALVQPPFDSEFGIGYPQKYDSYVVFLNG